MRVSATHIVLEHSGRFDDDNPKFRKVYELSNGDYVYEDDEGLCLLSKNVFHNWESNYELFKNYFK